MGAYREGVGIMSPFDPVTCTMTERSAGELPTTCRECDENERTYNTFRCPECHPEMSPNDHPPLATEYDGAE